MQHYNPANDPEVINGKQEAYGFRVGDIVEFTNSNGVVFCDRQHKVIGFVPESTLLMEKFRERTIYIDSDSPWFAVKPHQLRKLN